jgi:predicted flap endonuclease-1-like 5' DNA nuclease
VIWHILEVWLLLLAAFVAGCLLGSLINLLIAQSPMARPQAAFADAVGGTIDVVKHRLGLVPVWRPDGYRRDERHFEDRFANHPESYARETAAEERWERPPPAEPMAERQNLAPEIAEADVREAEWIEPEQDADWREPAWEEAVAAAVIAPAAAEPVALPPPEEEEKEPEPELPSMRPAGLAAPRNGVPDDLQRIRGIGKKNEELLNELGIFHFGQIAAWTPAEARWVAAHIAFPERIERDDWIGQATVLATGGDTGYVKASDRKAKAESDDPDMAGRLTD